MQINCHTFFVVYIFTLHRVFFRRSASSCKFCHIYITEVNPELHKILSADCLIFYALKFIQGVLITRRLCHLVSNLILI